VCHILNWQLTKQIGVPCTSAHLAHVLAMWLVSEAASGDSKVTPAKAHTADTLQLCKGQVCGKQMQGTPERAHTPVTNVHHRI
jgi:hypothetical protein